VEKNEVLGEQCGIIHPKNKIVLEKRRIVVEKNQFIGKQCSIVLPKNAIVVEKRMIVGDN